MIPRTCVLKLGGTKVEQPADLSEVALHVEHLVRQGYLPVLVHGGGGEIAALHDALAMDREKRDGLRVTPDASMDLVTMVLAGMIPKLRAATAALDAGVGRVRVGDLGTMRRETCTVVAL